MSIKIESGVPIPSSEFRVTDAIRSMRVGDSFEFPSEKRFSVGSVASKILGAGNYTIRKNGNMARIWRVA